MRRFARKEDGATAIEFGIVAVPFFALLFAILETVFVLYAGQTLENAVSDSSRLIMTGQAQTKGMGPGAFKEAVCARIYGLFDCENGVHIDVKSYPSFAAVDLTDPLDANGNFQNNQTYQPGVAGDIVVVRLFYQWPVHVSLLLKNMSGNRRLLVATAAFRNEPFGATTPTPPSP